jgi:beta-glucuronidase
MVRRGFSLKAAHRAQGKVVMKKYKKAQRVSIICLTALCLTGYSPMGRASTVRVEKTGTGDWQLLVDDKPFVVKGVVYKVSVVGDDPGNGTARDWMTLDLNENGKNDVAYDTWVDANRNNRQDDNEPAVGDWRLLKDMGVNTIRIYQMPSDDPRVMGLYLSPGQRLEFGHASNKKILRDLFNRYGIRVVAGHFFGEWTLGSGTTWAEGGTDYTNPRQRKNLLTSVRVMVEEHKDEPYILMWMLGNENFNPYDQDNAETEVEAFLTLVNEAAELIHSLDPDHPVAICNWHMQHIEDIARYAPAVDIFGMNNYESDLSPHYPKLKQIVDRPVLITEYGYQAKMRTIYDEGAQARYHLGVWKNISDNFAGGNGAGNSIGGLIFSWNDQWWLGGTPYDHDSGDFLGVPGAEWYGITGQGDGKSSPYLRTLRKAYYIYKSLWTDG